MSYIIKRTGSRIITFIVVISLIFFLARSAGSDPFERYLSEDPRIPLAQIQRLRARFGLDKPLHMQYLDFIKNTLQGEFGYSLYYKRPVFDIVMERLPWTLFLLSISIILSTIISFVVGVYFAWKRGTKTDILGTNICMFIRSTPHFWLGMILLLVFAYYYPIFPLFGARTPGIHYANTFEYIKDILYHATLPLTTLLLRQVGMYILYMRNSTVEVLGEDYMVTAKAKGVPAWSLMFHHAARNAMLPMVTVTAMRFGFMVNGAILTETVFSYPGTGRLIYQAITNDDFFLLQGAFFIVSITVLIANLIADLICGWLDPRIKI
ncbi:MAG: ABC transporter permease [Candidatus Bathyarchaeota archaeon]|nr:ABC transporter permease [Candidatus Bathyarchaeota archaeon]MDH5791171.1 ABC transporter permease [Candidatus Bathyarchaeota archaeon]